MADDEAFASSSQAGAEDEEYIDVTEVELLKTAWRNETEAPEILPYEDELVKQVQEQIELQEENLRAFPASHPAVIYYTLDLRRVYFLLRAYLRIRLSKIEEYVLHILNTPELYSRLSLNEQEYAKGFVDLQEVLMGTTVLDRMPPKYGSLLKQSDTSETHDMISEPSLDTFVFALARENIGTFQVDDEGDETINLTMDDLYILRYRPIRRLVKEKKMDLV